MTPPHFTDEETEVQRSRVLQQGVGREDEWS
jgi:hypothetical protein